MQLCPSCMFIHSFRVTGQGMKKRAEPLTRNTKRGRPRHRTLLLLRVRIQLDRKYIRQDLPITVRREQLYHIELTCRCLAESLSLRGTENAQLLQGIWKCISSATEVSQINKGRSSFLRGRKCYLTGVCADKECRCRWVR